MKTLIAIIALTTSTLSFASFNTVNCDSVRGTNNSLSLIIVDHSLKQIRVINGLRVKALVPSKVVNQELNGVTLYSVSGVVGLMKVENKVLEGNGGLVSLSNDEFSCF